jgi:hypothetical protein
VPVQATTNHVGAAGAVFRVGLNGYLGEHWAGNLHGLLLITTVPDELARARIRTWMACQAGSNL